MGENIIYKLVVQRDGVNHTYEVGVNGVASMTTDIIQTGVGDGYTPSKMVYLVEYDDGRSVEIDSRLEGAIVYRKPVCDVERNDVLKDTLVRFMAYMQRRGFFDPEAQFDFDHQAETFIEQFNHE